MVLLPPARGTALVMLFVVVAGGSSDMPGRKWLMVI